MKYYRVFTSGDRSAIVGSLDALLAGGWNGWTGGLTESVASSALAVGLFPGSLLRSAELVAQVLRDLELESEDGTLDSDPLSLRSEYELCGWLLNMIRESSSPGVVADRGDLDRVEGAILDALIRVGHLGATATRMKSKYHLLQALRDSGYEVVEPSDPNDWSQYRSLHLGVAPARADFSIRASRKVMVFFTRRDNGCFEASAYWPGVAWTRGVAVDELVGHIEARYAYCSIRATAVERGWDLLDEKQGEETLLMYSIGRHWEDGLERRTIITIDSVGGVSVDVIPPIPDGAEPDEVNVVVRLVATLT